MTKKEEIRNKHKHNTDHWADQDYDDESVDDALEEYGKYCAEQAWYERHYYDNTLIDFEDWWNEFKKKENENT